MHPVFSSKHCRPEFADHMLTLREHTMRQVSTGTNPQLREQMLQMAGLNTQPG